jgi:hypothetical protein
VKVDDQSTPELFTPKDIFSSEIFMDYVQGFNFFVRPVNLSAQVWRQRHRCRAFTAPAHCWGRRVFGISHRDLATEIRSAVQLPSQKSDWSSVEGEAAVIFIWSIERSRCYVFCPAKFFLVESILTLSPTHPLHVPNSIASLIPLVDSF